MQLSTPLLNLNFSILKKVGATEETDKLFPYVVSVSSENGLIASFDIPKEQFGQVAEAVTSPELWAIFLNSVFASFNTGE